MKLVQFSVGAKKIWINPAMVTGVEEAAGSTVIGLTGGKPASVTVTERVEHVVRALQGD